MDKPDADVKEDSSVSIFGFDITSYSERTKFFILSGIFVITAVLYGYLQESVFTAKGFHYSGTVTLLTHATLLALSGIQRYTVDKEERKGSLRMYAVLAALTMGSLYVTNWASTLLSYSTRTVFKSSKLLTVMAMGCLQKKVYTKSEYGAAFVLVCSLFFFTLGDATVRPDFSALGIVLIAVAVLGDAATVNLEEGHFLKKLRCPQSEVIFFVNVFSTIGAFGIAVFSGEFPDAITYFYLNPAVFGQIIAFCVAGYAGVTSVLTVVKVFGAANMEILKGGRKLLTLVRLKKHTCIQLSDKDKILSFLAFSKPWSINYFYGFLCLLTGTVLQYRAKQLKAASQATVTQSGPSAEDLAAEKERRLFQDEEKAEHKR